MVLCATAPGVVGDLVVVPDRDPRVLPVPLLQVRVGSVLGVAGAVIVEGDDLAIGLRDPPETRAVTVANVRVLVDIVAEVQDGIEVGAVGNAAIRIEVAGRKVGARGDRETNLRDVRGR